MSQYLRLTYNLLVELGGVSSPEIFDSVFDIHGNGISPERIDYKSGTTKYEPETFSFFQGETHKSYIVGHIHRESGPSLPIFYAIVSSGILLRSNGQLHPFAPPIIREVVLVPENLTDKESAVTEHIEAGLDIERYRQATTYHEIRQNASRRIWEILSGVKQDVFLSFQESIKGEDHLILVDGSLSPTPEILQYGNWVGIFNNPKLSPVEEETSLFLNENEIGVPFKSDTKSNGYYWHLRMYSDMRKGPGWGLIKLENAHIESDDMTSKIESVSAAILAERYPIHPLSEKEGWRLYPLITARMFLKTQTTDEGSIMKYF